MAAFLAENAERLRACIRMKRTPAEAHTRAPRAREPSRRVRFACNCRKTSLPSPSVYNARLSEAQPQLSEERSPSPV